MESVELNVIRQVVEKGFGNADMNIIDQFIADNWIEHQQTLKGGKEVLKKAIMSLAKAFPDRRYELANHSVVGDTVWVHYKFSAIHAGAFMGIEPTGKKIMIDVMDIARIQNGQIIEHWGIPDRFTLLMQLGFFQSASNKS
ncbi:MAG: ester cyclase [Bacteroidetes bacterium]|nr:ester cyclase [Bacteroidota bacterium]